MRALRNYYAYYVQGAEFLLIHIPKNGGMTIRNNRELYGRIVAGERLFLKNRAYVRGLESTMKAHGMHHGLAHGRLRDYRPAVLDRLQPVAILRNPWSRVVSRFTYSVARDSLPPDHLSSITAFERFLDERHEWGGKPYFWHRAIKGWYPATDYVTDTDGNIGADILRLEHLTQESFQYFGLETPPTRKNSSPTGKLGYREYYTPKTIQIVADWYKIDIDTFGFDFDSSATRNYFYETRDPSVRGRGRK